MNNDYQKKFHNIFGHATTLKSALSMLSDDYKESLSAEVNEMIEAMKKHTNDMIVDLEELREKIYKIIEK